MYWIRPFNILFCIRYEIRLNFPFSSQIACIQFFNHKKGFAIFYLPYELIKNVFSGFSLKLYKPFIHIFIIVYFVSVFSRWNHFIKHQPSPCLRVINAFIGLWYRYWLKGLSLVRINYNRNEIIRNFTVFLFIFFKLCFLFYSILKNSDIFS